MMITIRGLCLLFCILCTCGISNAQLIVAHRGASYDAPENTLAAFQLAWEKGADAIEVDIYLTADGKIACIHDPKTKRVGGVDLSVARSTLDELKRLDVGSWKDQSFAGERIPSLSEVLAVVPKTKKIFIEIKSSPEIVPALKRELKASGLTLHQVNIISFQPEVILRVKEELPHYMAYWLVDFKWNEENGVWTPTCEEVLRKAERIHADGLDMAANAKVIDQDFVRRCREENMSVNVWTVDDPEKARHFQQLQVDSITTNRPDVLSKSLLRTDSSHTTGSSNTTAVLLPTECRRQQHSKPSSYRSHHGGGWNKSRQHPRRIRRCTAK